MTKLTAFLNRFKFQPALSPLILLVMPVLFNLLPGVAVMKGQTTQAVPVPDCLFFISVTFSAASTAVVPSAGGFDNRSVGCQTWTVEYVATGTGSLTSVDFQAASGATAAGAFSTWGGTVATGVNPNTGTDAISTFTTGCVSASACATENSWVTVLLTRGTFVGTIRGVVYGYRSGYPGSGGGGGGGGGCSSPCPVTQSTVPWQVDGNVAPGSAASNPVTTGFRDSSGNALADYGFPQQAAVTISAGTDVVAVAGVSSTNTYVGHLTFTMDTPQTVTIRQGTGTTCGTNTVILYGPAPGVVTLALDYDSKGALHTTVAARDLCIHLSGAATLGGGVTYGTH